MSYGVLQHMNDTPIDKNGKTLLDEIDVISSVSGGSFASGYLGVFGKAKFLERFKQDVLFRPIQRDVILRIFEPWNWPQLFLYGRSDVADSYYNDEIFAGRTFANMPLSRPFIIINATDISLGARFEFSQDYFDRICSDLSSIPISRAVTASSAFPVAFPPITLKNYGGSPCGYRDPGWVPTALKDFYHLPTRYDRAKTWVSYEDATVRPFIHLSDGGLSDNIGLRGPEVALTTSDSSWSLLNKVNRGEVKRIAVIVVDAEPGTDQSLDQSARRPLFTSVLEEAATNPMENYSSDTIELLRQSFQQWDQAAKDFEARQTQCNELATQTCDKSTPRDACEKERRQQCYVEFNATDNYRPPHPTLYRVHVRLDAVKDPALRKRLDAIPTALEISQADVELLIKAGADLLDKSPGYRQFIQDLRADVTPGPGN